MQSFTFETIWHNIFEQAHIYQIIACYDRKNNEYYAINSLWDKRRTERINPVIIPDTAMFEIISDYISIIEDLIREYPYNKALIRYKEKVVFFILSYRPDFFV